MEKILNPDYTNLLIKVADKELPDWIVIKASLDMLGNRRAFDFFAYNMEPVWEDSDWQFDWKLWTKHSSCDFVYLKSTRVFIPYWSWEIRKV